MMLFFLTEKKLGNAAGIAGPGTMLKISNIRWRDACTCILTSVPGTNQLTQ